MSETINYADRTPEALVRIENIKKYFPLEERRLSWFKRYVKAVDGVSFFIRPGETFSLVGESGCGKSTLGRAVAALHPVTSGEVYIEGQNIASLNTAGLKAMRKKVQFIFQDPSAALNPRLTIGDTLLEPFRIHREFSPKERGERIAYLMDKVGLSAYHLTRYPHELSGGQKQRIGIARALALNPSVIICDEVVSALDVSIQAQVINLLADLQKEFFLTYLFISHNLSVVHHVSDRVGVMYLGKLVEVGDKVAIFDHPRHPYTRALLSAILGNSAKRIILQGEPPSPSNPPQGCRFHTRCPHCTELCETTEAPLEDSGRGHLVACHHVIEGGKP
jgi:peptide/nickel transport system ATP-binding protein/oligopeptide transport system ATP-binding protein